MNARTPSGIHNSARDNAPSTAVARTDPRPAFYLCVAGDEGLDPDWVGRKLDAFTGRIRPAFNFSIVGRGGGAARAWAKKVNAGLILEPVMRHAGRYAEPLWAMRVASMCSGIVIFGRTDRWWRLLRYARDGGVPVRVVEVPAQALRREDVDRPVPRAIVPVPGLTAETWGDYFPDGPPRRA